MTTESDLFGGVQSIIDLWDELSEAERDRMPDEVWDAIIDLRHILDAQS